MSELDGTESVHEPQPLTAFNAIKMSASDVASSFVPPPAFDALVNAGNAILTGPRGSGKTTLLKMLGSEALEQWQDERADNVRRRVTAVGVFVGSDRTWNEQLMAPPGAAGNPAYAALAWAAFGTHTMRSIVDAMNYRTRGPHDGKSARHLRVNLERSTEAALAADLGDYLEIGYGANSLPVLHELLGRRLATIGQLRRHLHRGEDVDMPSWVDMDVLEVTNQLIIRFNRAAGEPDRRWSLLFDELELAPEAIVEELIGALRGHQPLLLLKLSLAPADSRFERIALPGRPVAGQDYEHIALTYARKLRAVAFARQLATMQLRAAGMTGTISIDRVLGQSLFDSREDDELPAYELGSASGSRPYRRGTALWHSFSRLSTKDATFRTFLSRNELDLENLDSLDATMRAAKLRKVRNIVVTREYFRSNEGTRRSRKSSDLYTGSASMMSLPDGNPRMIIALVRQLFPLVEAGGASITLPRNIQAAALEVTLARFRALLKAQEPVNINGELVSLTNFLDDVGGQLSHRLIEEDFTDNVSLTFVLDRNVRPEIRELVVRAVNTGALVYVPQRGDSGEMPYDLLGSQFRLCYLLCAHYGLPIHLTRSTSLSSLLPPAWTKPGNGRRRRGQLDAGQGVLVFPSDSGGSER